MAEKITRRQLRSPDKFAQTTGGWLEWAQSHPRETAIAGAGLLLALLIVGFLFGGSGEIRVDRGAGGALSEALELVDRPVGEDAAGDDEAFATEEEKRSAIADALSRIRGAHGGKPAGLTATLGLADVSFHEGKLDEALALYDDFLSRSAKGHALRFVALEGRALALEAKGSLDEALAAFSRIEAELPEQKAIGLYGKARLLERQGKWEDARSAWESLKEDFGTTAAGMEANSRLARLNLLHPKAQEASEG